MKNIIEKINIVDIIQQYIPLTKKGKVYFGVCPFHEDNKNSLSISEEKQTYKCFSCGANGNVITFVENYNNISTDEAVKMIEKIKFDKLDNTTHSLNCGRLTCIAGRPGVGKTTLLISTINNIIEHHENDRILFVSLENSKEQLKEKIKSDNVEIITDKVFINDIEDVCRRLDYKYYNLYLIVIDYLQLIKPEINRKDALREKMDIIKSLKQLAVELNMPIIITSQLPYLEDKKIPTLEDLNGTTYYYDKVMLLYNDDNNLKLSIVKNKGGSCRTVDLTFNNERSNFEKRK